MGLGTMMQWLLDKYHTKYYELSTNEKGRTGWTHIVSRIKGRSMIAKYPTLLRDLSMLPGITPDDRIATLGMNLGEGLLDRIDEFALFTIYAALDRDDSYAILSRVAERGGMTIDEIIERLRLGGVKNIPDDKLLAAFMGLSRRTTHEAGKNGGVGIGEGEWAWREWIPAPAA